MWRCTLTMVLAYGLGGCALLGSGGGSSGSIMDPDWVERGAALVVEDKDRYFVAVGQARDKLRAPLLKKIAQKKAMDAIEEPIKNYLKVLAGPWIASLDPKIMKVKPKPGPIIMLDKLLERCAKMAAIEEVYVGGDGSYAWAMSRVDLMPIIMEMQASTDVQILLEFLVASNIDPNIVFDKVASGELGGPPPKEEEKEEPPAEKSEEEGEKADGAKKEVPAEEG
jgi:hypothetical protein